MPPAGSGGPGAWPCTRGRSTTPAGSQRGLCRSPGSTSTTRPPTPGPNCPTCRVARDHFHAQVAAASSGSPGAATPPSTPPSPRPSPTTSPRGPGRPGSPRSPRPGGDSPPPCLATRSWSSGGRAAVRPSTRWRPTTPRPTPGEPWPPCPPLATGSRRPCATEGCTSPPAERSRAVADRPTSTRCSSWVRPTPCVPDIPIGFGKSIVQGETSAAPTSLQFGPDGRLYVGQFNGLIKAYTVARNGPNNYSVTTTETISLIQSIPNHDDDGTLEPLDHYPAPHRNPRRGHGIEPGHLRRLQRSSDRRRLLGIGPEPGHELQHDLEAHLERVNAGRSSTSCVACLAPRRTTPPTACSWTLRPTRCTSRRAATPTRVRRPTTSRSCPSSRCPRRSCRWTSTRSGTRRTTSPRSTTRTERGPQMQTTPSEATTARTRRSSSQGARFRSTRRVPQPIRRGHHRERAHVHDR